MPVCNQERPGIQHIRGESGISAKETYSEERADKAAGRPDIENKDHEDTYQETP
jgi:hypothetical protein